MAPPPRIEKKIKGGVVHAGGLGFPAFSKRSARQYDAERLASSLMLRASGGRCTAGGEHGEQRDCDAFSLG
jgi:hypothetical protein